MRAIATIGIGVAESAHIVHQALDSEPTLRDPTSIERHAIWSWIERGTGWEHSPERADRNDTSHERVVDRVVGHEHVNGAADRSPQRGYRRADLSGSSAGVNSHTRAAPASQ